MSSGSSWTNPNGRLTEASLTPSYNLHNLAGFSRYSGAIFNSVDTPGTGTAETGPVSVTTWRKISSLSAVAWAFTALDLARHDSPPPDSALRPLLLLASR